MITNARSATMMRSFAHCGILFGLQLMALTSSAFVLPSRPHVIVNKQVILSSSFPADHEVSDDKVQTPAVVHGRPINDDIKKFNYELIRLLKTVLFDNLYPSSSISVEDSPQVQDIVLKTAYARFWSLETIARVPYFSYLSVLHMYETLGMWRQSDYLKLHFAENWNELDHLLIMEELLGSELKWFDRFLAEHIAIVYGWTIFALYLLNPTWAYNLNQVVEEEAYQSYTCFLELTGEVLRAKPAPQTAQDYYSASDGFNLQDLPLAKSMKHLARKQTRPKCKTLYDTFALIRQDELEHAATMSFLQQE